MHKNKNIQPIITAPQKIAYMPWINCRSLNRQDIQGKVWHLIRSEWIHEFWSCGFLSILAFFYTKTPRYVVRKNCCLIVHLMNLFLREFFSLCKVNLKRHLIRSKTRINIWYWYHKNTRSAFLWVCNPIGVSSWISEMDNVFELSCSK